MAYFDIAAPVINSLATVALFWAAGRSKKVSKRLGLAWTMLAFSQLAFTLGDIVWAVLELGFGISPYPSIADGLYLLTYPFFLTGVMLMTKQERTLPERLKHGLDFAVVLSAGAMGCWRYLLHPALTAGVSTSFTGQVLAIAYPTGDLILFASMVWMINFNLKLLRKPAILLLMAAAFFTIASDLLFSYQSNLDLYVSGNIVDMGWIISYILMGFSGIFQGRSTEKQYTEDEFSIRDHFNQSTLETILTYFPYVWVVFAYLLLPLTNDEPFRSEITILYVGVGITIGLVVIRQFVALYENRKLAGDLQSALDQVQQQTQMLEKTNRDLETEIQQRTKVEKQLIFDAMHDPLTQLPNRAMFTDLLEQKIQDSKEHPNHVFSVLFMDIDQFKVINDSLGHTIGDQLLAIIARRLENCLRASDTVARLGGDEFVFLIQNTATENAVDFIVKRIREEIQKVIFLGQHPFYITTSIGVVWNLRGYDTPGNVLRDADLAMYHAKRMGKDRFEVFHEGLRLQAISRLEIEENLRNAISDNQLMLFYQPIHCLTDDRIVGFEALIRWNHPTYGILFPVEFLSIAEESGQCAPISAWSLTEACNQVMAWKKKYPFFENCYVSVNMSGAQIKHPDFIALVKKTFHETGVDPSLIRMEITENSLIENDEGIMKIFSQLRAMGIQLVIDDFGTGYSSLAYIQDFPVQSLKIDKSFVREVGIRKSASDLVKTMITLGHDLGMEVVAEGIESQIQKDELVHLSCRFGQGFLLSLPKKAGEIEELLRERNLFATLE